MPVKLKVLQIIDNSVIPMCKCVCRVFKALYRLLPEWIWMFVNVFAFSSMRYFEIFNNQTTSNFIYFDDITIHKYWLHFYKHFKCYFSNLLIFFLCVCVAIVKIKFHKLWTITEVFEKLWYILRHENKRHTHFVASPINESHVCQ